MSENELEQIEEEATVENDEAPVTEETEFNGQPEDLGENPQPESQQRISVGISPFGAVIVAVTDRDGNDAAALLTVNEVHRLIGQLTTLAVTVTQQAMMEQAAMRQAMQEVQTPGGLVLPGNIKRR